VWLRAIGRLGDRFPRVYELDARHSMRQLLADLERHRESDAADPGSLRWSERSDFSQNGEDGVIVELFRRIGETNRWFVEIGASDGGENCTRRLAELGWSGVWVEADPETAERARQVAPDPVEVVGEPALRSTISARLGSTGLTAAPDLLVVDNDSDDLGVLEACLVTLTPRVVVAEYNGAFPPACSWSLPARYDSGWDGSFRHGASLRALADALDDRGYRLVHCDSTGVNSFFVRADQLDEHLERAASRRIKDAYRAPAFTAHPFGHPRSARSVVPMKPLTVEQVGAISFRELRLDHPGARVEPGAALGFTFEIENRCGETLSSGGPNAFHLSARWLDNDGVLPPGAPRTALPFPLASGSARTAHLWVRAPDDAGTHTLRVTGVCERVAWREELGRDGAFAEATIVVG